jgi:hypothetical protein
MTMLPRNRTKALPGIEPRLMPWPTSKSGTTNKQLLRQETETKSLTGPEVGEEAEDVVVVQEMVEVIAVKEEVNHFSAEIYKPGLSPIKKKSEF